MTPSDRVTPPPDLVATIAGDLRPVRPGGSLRRRVALTVPLGLTLFVGLPLVVGLRADAASLGPVVTWGMSALQVTLGMWLIWAGARESVPGRRLPFRVGAIVLAAAALAVVTIAMVTFARSPTTVRDVLLLPWTAGAFCFRGSVALGAPSLFLAGWLLGRALPGQPWLAGALFGAGAGLTADATWRLVCPVSDPWHVITGHGGAVLTLTVAGAVGGYVAARRRVAAVARR